MKTIKEIIGEQSSCIGIPNNGKIRIDIFGQSQYLGMEDRVWDIYNELEERFNVIDWSFKQQKNQQCCLEIIIKAPKRFTRFTNALGNFIWVDNETGEEYKDRQELDKLVQLLVREFVEKR